jgi:glutathione peroxidase
MTDNINDIIVRDAQGKDVFLIDFDEKVRLIVNVASECGFTPQYEGLQKIYTTYKDRDFEILAFPCNDFGGQEPGTNTQIQEFCSVRYGVKFKLFDKVKILGNNKSPLYERLTNNTVTEKKEIQWNFEKFLISKEGKIVARFPSDVTPESNTLISAIEAELNR